MKDKILLLIILSSFFTLQTFLIYYSNPIFDEVWYISAARTFLKNGTYERLEHPPLAQLFIALGIKTFGDTPTGWRVFSIVFGTLSLTVFYFIAIHLFKNPILALSATLLLSIEKMFFTFSSLATLDIFFLFFMLSSIYTFLIDMIPLSALFMALSVNCKFTAFLTFPLILTFHIVNTWRRRSLHRPIKTLTVWILLSIAFTIIFLPLLDNLYTATSTISTPLHHLKYMFQIHTSEYWPSGIGESPWIWLIYPKNYYLGGLSFIRSITYESFNPLITSLAIISTPYTLYLAAKEDRESHLLPSLWFLFLYTIWIPIHYLFSRPLFSFYLLPATPAIILMNLNLFKDSRYMMGIYITANLLYFLLLNYPVHLILQ